MCPWSTPGYNVGNVFPNLVTNILNFLSLVLDELLPNDRLFAIICTFFIFIPGHVCHLPSIFLVGQKLDKTSLKTMECISWITSPDPLRGWHLGFSGSLWYCTQQRYCHWKFDKMFPGKCFVHMLVFWLATYMYNSLSSSWTPLCREWHFIPVHLYSLSASSCHLWECPQHTLFTVDRSLVFFPPGDTSDYLDQDSSDPFSSLSYSLFRTMNS